MRTVVKFGGMTSEVIWDGYLFKSSYKVYGFTASGEYSPTATVRVGSKNQND